jgi:hypothetical protein
MDALVPGTGLGLPDGNPRHEHLGLTRWQAKSVRVAAICSPQSTTPPAHTQVRYTQGVQARAQNSTAPEYAVSTAKYDPRPKYPGLEYRKSNPLDLQMMSGSVAEVPCISHSSLPRGRPVRFSRSRRSQ